jgi:hypothetical protein
VIVYCFLALMLWAIPCPAEKRALLVGVNDYTRGPAEWDLRGCENDVLMTRQLLVERFGFPEQNIKVLLNGEATAAAILASIREWLVLPVKPEDAVYFHFSGHGSQVRDFEGDEEDGYDEIICPTDMQQGVWASVITDDQLKVALDQIPARQATIVLDACHSGTGTRDISLSRPRFARFDPGPATRGLSAPASAAAQAPGPGDSQGKQWVTISGCRPDQTSADAWIRDGFYAGALTYHLVENMKKAAPGTPVKTLIEQVRRDLQGASYSQVPQVEGDLDLPVLGLVPGPVRPPHDPVKSSIAGMKLKLLVEVDNAELLPALSAAVASLDFAEVAAEGERFDHRLRVAIEGGLWQGALTVDGAVGERVQGQDARALVAALRPQLENAYAVKFLAGLDNPSPPFGVSLWATGGAEGTAEPQKLVQARVGSLLTFSFEAERDCHLTLIDLGTSGKITVLFPNQYQPDGFVKAGRVYQTGTRGMLPFQIRATGPPGRELVKVIATADSLALSSLKLGKAGAAGTRSIEAGSEFVRQLARDLSIEGLEEKAEDEPALTPGEWATDYLIVETVP